MGVHRNTLNKYIKLHKISKGFTQISNVSLDKVVRQFKRTYPDSGIRYLTGYMRHRRLRVPRRRIYASMKRVDRLGHMIRSRFKKVKAMRERKYKVSRPNALWHQDGHHKLGMYGIVIHGAVDGYSRMVRCLAW